MQRPAEPPYKLARGIAAAVACALSLWSAQSQAAAGAFVGGSAGQATVKDNEHFEGQSFSMDESDTAWKIFGGYMFNTYVGVEGGYVNLGSPDKSFGFDGGESAKLEGSVTGYTADIVGSYPLGPVDLFAKIGDMYGQARVQATVTHLVTQSYKITDSESKNVLTYGVGAMYNIGAFGIRAEFEMYDVQNVDDVYLISVGAQYRF